MTKTRVHDLAAEFGIDSEHLIRLLAEVDIHVRSHLSSLDAGQVAIVRARWERGKRKHAEPEAPKKTTGRRARPKAAEPEPEPEARPRRRRRTAAEMAERDAVLEEEKYLFKMKSNPLNQILPRNLLSKNLFHGGHLLSYKATGMNQIKIA